MPLEQASSDTALAGCRVSDTYFEVFRPVIDGDVALDDVVGRVREDLGNLGDVEYGGPVSVRYGEQQRSILLASSMGSGQQSVRVVSEALSNRFQRLHQACVGTKTIP